MPNKTTQNRRHQQRRSSQQNRTNAQHSQTSSRNPGGEASMAEKTKPISDLFGQAMSSYEEAFQTGLRLQEESGRCWTMLLEQNGPSREWQKAIRSVATELLPDMQKRMEDGLRMVEHNSRASLEFLKLIKKGVEMPQNNPLTGSQARLISFWEASLNSVKDSAQAVAQANSRAMESWMDLFRKSTEMVTERTRA